MSICGKCNLAIDASGDYAGCTSCPKRYHFGSCSVSSTIWRQKTQAMKDEWKCDKCIVSSHSQLAKQSAPSVQSKSETSNVSQSSDGLKMVQEYFMKYSKEQDEKLAGLKMALKNHSCTLYSNLEKLIKNMSADILREISTMESTNKQLCKDNDFLKTELLLAQEKIASLELKMLDITHTGSTGVLKSAVDKEARMMMPQYSHVLAKDSPNIANGSSSQSKVSQPAVLTKVTPSYSASFPVLKTPSTANPAAKVAPSEDWTLVQDPRGRGRRNQAKTGDVPSAGDHGRDDTRQNRRSGPPPKIGKRASLPGNGDTHSLPMVKPKVIRKTSALFVSRFEPSVSSQDIVNMVQGACSPPLSHLKVSKIKTRHLDQYSSFHVEVLTSDFERIDNVDMWPDGCLIKCYYGRLLTEIVLNENE